MVNQWYGPVMTAEERAHMYRPMGRRFWLSSRTDFARRFVRSSLNILSRRSPIHGMPVWYTPGSAAAVSTFNRAAAAMSRIKAKLGGDPPPAGDRIPNPF
jgi:hypothetical protein